MMRYLRRSIDPRHQYRRWIDSRYRSLRLADVISYLRERGWKQLPADRTGLLAFHEPTGALVNGQPVCQFVPDSEAYDDYTTVMFELITGLAEFEDRQASEVIDDILRVGSRNQTDGTAQQDAHEAEATAK